MKIVGGLLLICLLSISCNPSSKERPFYLLAKCSGLNFNETNAKVMNFREEMSGMTKSQGEINALFKTANLNKDSLRSIMLALGYKRLPITELVMGDDSTDLRTSDTGYYKLESVNNAIDVLVVVNFTQHNVSLYKPIQ